MRSQIELEYFTPIYKVLSKSVGLSGEVQANSYMLDR
jgi:hypothetical protein